MRTIGSVVLLAALLLFGASGDTWAQGAPRQPAAGKKADARRAAKPNRTDQSTRLDALYEALRQAPNAEIAKTIETRIDRIMAQSGSDTADLLMARARILMEQKDYDRSLALLDTAINLKPDFIEAFAQRATVHYLKKDLVRSLADLRVVIAREPRHYASFAGLGVILQDIGEERRALEAFRRAQAINPHLKSLPQMIKRLEVKVEGRDI